MPPDDHAEGSRRLEWSVVAAALVLMGILMVAVQRPGHWWGDDWALYLRQADALIHGTTRHVIAENEFTVAMSEGAPFSPPMYPWGYPLILAPFVAAFGLDIDALSVVTVLCALAFAAGWYLLARRRLGPVAAIGGTVAITLSPMLFTWSELLQSEWPFMAVTFLALAGLDHAAASGVLVERGARWWPLVALGVGAAGAFSVRKEGLAMVAAIAAAQLAAVVDGRRWRGRDWPALRWLGARLLVPHVAALVSVAGLQVALPTTVVPQYSGTTIANTWRFWSKHLSHLAQVTGFRKPWAPEPAVFGHVTAGWWVFGAFLGFAGLGIVLALVFRRRRDLHLFAYALAAFAIGGSFMYANNRYVVTVGPILLLFAMCGLAWVAGGTRRPAVATAVVVVALLPLVASDGWFAWQRYDTTRRILDAGTIEWGPTHPDAVAMLDAVRELTPPDAVVAAPKARAMGLLTGRHTVQVDDYRPMPTRVRADYVVTEPTSSIPAKLADGPFTVIWSNSRFTLYRNDGP